jgi:hypothetical protein
MNNGKDEAKSTIELFFSRTSSWDFPPKFWCLSFLQTLNTQH